MSCTPPGVLSERFYALMRMCPTKEITDGMILGRSIYQGNGRLLLAAGYRITYDVKSRLLDRHYPFVYVMESGTEDIIPEDVITDEIRLQSSAALDDQADKVKKFFQFQNLSRDRVYDMLKNGYLKNMNITRDMRTITEEILKDITSAGVKFMNTILFKSRDSYLLDHAINTTILAILIGRKYRFSQSELLDLALGTFLHDFGKIIIEKIREASPGKLADDLLAEHPTFGYLLLRNSRDSSPVVSQIVNQHHECQDGSGYPIGLKGQNLPPLKTIIRETKGTMYRLAEITAVANAYDGMVLNPFKEKQLSPIEAMKQLVLKAGDKYNKDIIATLNQIVPVFPVGTYVRIKNIIDPTLIGYRGVVAKLNENNLNKPLIILLKDRSMKRIEPAALDTSKLKTIELELIM